MLMVVFQRLGRLAAQLAHRRVGCLPGVDQMHRSNHAAATRTMVTAHAGSGQSMMVVVVGYGFQNEPGPTMDVSIFVETTFDSGETRRRNIGRLGRAPDELGPANLGLPLDEAKQLLRRLQEAILQEQIDESLSARRKRNVCCRVALNWALPQSVWRNGSILARNNSVPARPYMARLRVFRRLI